MLVVAVATAWPPPAEPPLALLDFVRFPRSPAVAQAAPKSPQPFMRALQHHVPRRPPGPRSPRPMPRRRPCRGAPGEDRPAVRRGEPGHLETGLRPAVRPRRGRPEGCPGHASTEAEDV